MFSELLASQYEWNFSSGSCRYAVRSWATGAHFLSRLLQSLLKVPHPTWLHWLLVWYYVCWSLCFVDHRKCFLSFHSKARGDRLGSIDKGDPVQYRVAVSFALHWWCERKLVQEIQRIQRGEFQAGALQGGIVALFFYFSPVKTELCELCSTHSHDSLCRKIKSCVFFRISVGRSPIRWEDVSYQITVIMSSCNYVLYEYILSKVRFRAKKYKINEKFFTLADFK